MKLIRNRDFRETRWKNGQGLSWDIASDPEGAGMDEFGWRFATARIEADVPFSDYPQVDRIFTLLEGAGLDLAFGNGRKLSVDRLFAPHPFACDVPAFCTLRNGPCLALNLFVRRGRWQADVDILSSNAELAHHGPLLLFVLRGSVAVGGEALDAHDAAVVPPGKLEVKASGSLLYAARLTEA